MWKDWGLVSVSPCGGYKKIMPVLMSSKLILYTWLWVHENGGTLKENVVVCSHLAFYGLYFRRYRFA